MRKKPELLLSLFRQNKCELYSHLQKQTAVDAKGKKKGYIC